MFRVPRQKPLYARYHLNPKDVENLKTHTLHVGFDVEDKRVVSSLGKDLKYLLLPKFDLALVI
jgi:hypothetical protein